MCKTRDTRHNPRKIQIQIHNLNTKSLKKEDTAYIVTAVKGNSGVASVYKTASLLDILLRVDHDVCFMCSRAKIEVNPHKYKYQRNGCIETTYYSVIIRLYCILWPLFRPDVQNFHIFLYRMNTNRNNRCISCWSLHRSTSSSMALTGFVLALAFVFTFSGFFGYGVSYVRPAAGKTISVPFSDGHDSTSPQQVHISMVGQDKMRISWITEAKTPATVDYGTTKGSNQQSASGSSSSYKYLLYTSGQIHDVVVGPLEPNTVYFYRFRSDPSQEFSFKTPPSQFPIKFAVVGDLGQTDWTNSTLQHIAASNYDVMLLPGDLSYADSLQPLWDSFGRLVEPLASQRPWMVTQGNHEVEKISLIHSQSFTSYNARWHMPFEESGSDSNLYYSFEVAGVHIIMLGSYTDFERDSAQYKWLQADLAKVDRSRTPWIVVLIHAPWYNSNTAHQGEYEADGMKQAMEGLLYGARVDVVFAGHVHAYERFASVYDDKATRCAPVYITIGDGGNREGLATKYKDPKPDISIFREASFGHGQFQVVNATHALWEWHRNDDDVSVVADTVWLGSHASNPACKV